MLRLTFAPGPQIVSAAESTAAFLRSPTLLVSIIHDSHPIICPTIVCCIWCWGPGGELGLTGGQGEFDHAGCWP